MPTCTGCKKYFKSYQKIDGIVRIVGKRKYCLDCKPYRFIGQINENLYSGNRMCRKCKRTLPLSDFYVNDRETGRPFSYCKSCSKKRVSDRLISIKESAVNYLGGKCSACGYNRCISALHFHHIDPSEKEFNLSAFRGNSFESIKKELDKCVLLCANCHAEIHNAPFRVTDGSRSRIATFTE